MIPPDNRKKANKPSPFHPWRAEIALSRNGRKRLAERKLRALLAMIEAREVTE